MGDLSLVKAATPLAGVVTGSRLAALEISIAQKIEEAQTSSVDAMLMMLEVQESGVWKDRVLPDGAQAHTRFTDWIDSLSDWMRAEYGFGFNASTVLNTLWMMRCFMAAGFDARSAAQIPVRTFYALNKGVEFPNKRNKLDKPRLRPNTAQYTDGDDDANEKGAAEIVKAVIDGDHGPLVNQWLGTLAEPMQRVTFFLWVENNKTQVYAQGEGPGIPGDFAQYTVVDDFDGLPDWVRSALVRELNIPQDYAPESELDA